MRLFLVFSLHTVNSVFAIQQNNNLEPSGCIYHCGGSTKRRRLSFVFISGRKKKEIPGNLFFFLTLKLQGTLHIPRPVLTVIQVPEEESSVHNSMSLPPTPPSSTSSSNELTMSVTGSFGYDRCDTPTRFTLLGESGVIVRTHRTTPTTCQLSMTFCTLALLALVGMIVYMEGKVLITLSGQSFKIIFPLLVIVYMNGSQV